MSRLTNIKVQIELSDEHDGWHYYIYGKEVIKGIEVKYLLYDGHDKPPFPTRQEALDDALTWKSENMIISSDLSA